MITFDKKGAGKAGTRSAFVRARKAETWYAGQLRKVAQHVGDIVKGFSVEDPAFAAQVNNALNRYSETISGWAEATATRMITEVADRDRAAWMEVSRQMGAALRREVNAAPTGQVMQERLREQVKLIKSLPTEAAERVNKLTTEALFAGRRAEDISKEIFASGDVSKSRANLIARTEVGRTATELTRARALYVGSTHFIWKTVGDGDVRKSHQALNNLTFRWDEPPECDPGIHALPGAVFNCRCIPVPVLPED